jgi:hypothetical protein
MTARHRMGAAQEGSSFQKPKWAGDSGAIWQEHLWEGHHVSGTGGQMGGQACGQACGQAGGQAGGPEEEEWHRWAWVGDTPRCVRKRGKHVVCHPLSHPRYSKEWEKTVKRLGRWIDFENDYKTLDPSFMESVWWVFSRLFEKGLVYRGFKVRGREGTGGDGRGSGAAG